MALRNIEKDIQENKIAQDKFLEKYKSIQIWDSRNEVSGE